MESINEFKYCKDCDETKDINLFKKHRHICKKCMYKKSNDAYKQKFKNYYIQQQDKRIEYQNEYYRKKVNKDNIKKSKVGRPRIINVIKSEETTKIET